MDTKALQQAEEAVKVAVAEYERLVAARTDYDTKIAELKEDAVNKAKYLKNLRKAAMADVSDLMGSISLRGRPALRAPGSKVATINDSGSGKKRGRPKKVA